MGHIKMSEQLSRQITAEEASRRIAADIRAYPQSADKREEHLRLFGALLSREDIEGAWADRYAEIARAGRGKLADLSSRLGGLRPKIDEAKHILAQPKVFRRFAKKEQSSANTALSFSVPATQPPADEKLKDTQRQAKPEEEQAEAQGSGSVEDVAKERQLSLTGGTVVIDNAAEMLAAMNERHGVVGNVGGKCRIVEWVPSELDPGVLVPSFQSKTDFINRYAHRQVGWTRRGDPLTLGQWWFENPQRADYRGVVFEPGAPNVIIRKETGRWLNLWRGWGVMPERGDWSLLRNHVEQILSAGDPAVADYNVRWAAWSFQHAGEQSEAAVVFRGKKGAGKGLWLGTLRVAHGHHGLHVTHCEHLTGRFNHHLWTCVYVFADEAFWAGDKQGEAILKSLITERPLMVEKKGVDTVQGVNRVKLGIASNMDWVVPASHDERRYAVTDIDNRYAMGEAPDEERKQYFGAISREIAEGGVAAMLYDLLQMDLGDWHPREIPTTAGLMRQKKESLRGNYQWFEALLQAGQLPVNAGRPNRIFTDDLLAYVKNFRGLEYATDESIASFLYGEMGFVAELSPEGNRFRAAKGGSRGWEFPPLLQLRSRWETKFHGKWHWHDDIDKWQLRAGLWDQSLA